MLKTAQDSQVKELLDARKDLTIQFLLGTIIIQLIVMAFFVTTIAITMKNMNDIIQFYSTIHNYVYEYREFVYFFGLVFYEEELWILVGLSFTSIFIFLNIFFINFIYKKKDKIHINGPTKLRNFLFFFLLNCVFFIFSFFHYFDILFHNMVSYNSHVFLLRRDSHVYIFKYISVFGKVLSYEIYPLFHFILDLMFFLICLFLLGLIILWVSTTYGRSIEKIRVIPNS